MSMPVDLGKGDKGKIEGNSPFKPQLLVLDYGFHRKKQHIFVFAAFRGQTTTITKNYVKKSLIISYLNKKDLTITRKF